MALFRILALCFAVFSVCGFVVEGPRQPAPDALVHASSAPRWAAGAGDLVTTGERGLGGGLEYAVDESVCAMRFIDGSDCAAVHLALAEALDEWASGHPALRFTDVSDRVEPAFPLAVFGDRAQGAEIDFFAAGGDGFPPFLNIRTTGYTIFYERPQAQLALTNGSMLRGIGQIESADVRFNAARCYYIDTAQGRPDCVHFPSLVLHEVGHALGIGHPEDSIGLNLDTDDDPTNEIVIDCRDPQTGLAPSPRYSGAAVAVGRDVQGPGRWRRGLTWDDVAARDFLYPHCGITKLDRFTVQWGAFAVSGAGHEGRSQLEVTPDSAAVEALRRCHAVSGGEACRVVAEFDGCFAYALGRDDAQGHAKSARSDHARVDAVLACSEHGSDCRAVADFCAFE
ncbi:MAG: DUF4189 domain-containing protein [Pseudomonadota bacterium]